MAQGDKLTDHYVNVNVNLGSKILSISLLLTESKSNFSLRHDLLYIWALLIL